MFIGILADDLTGAADSVAPFAQRGYRAGVGFASGGGTQDPDRSWDAFALNSELRDLRRLSPERIPELSAQATRRLIADSPQVYFKKIDSTLRGYLRPELDGMRGELPGRIALICPASPANGRTVERGVLTVEGVPLAETGFVERTSERAKFSTVRSAFEMADDPTAAEISLAVLQEGAAAVEAAIESHAGVGICTLFCDAVTSDDLRVLAQVVLRRPERYLPVGSAGFTRAIAESLPSGSREESSVWERDRFTQGRVLVAIGSMHPMSRRQAGRLMEGANVVPMILTRQDGIDIFGLEPAFREHFQAGDRLFVLTTPDERSEKVDRHPMAHALRMLSNWAGTPSPFDAVIATGGQTAQQVCYGLSGTELQICGESEPGIVRALLHRRGGLPSLPIVLKAGGFGEEDTLARCIGVGN